MGWKTGWPRKGWPRKGGESRVMLVQSALLLLEYHNTHTHTHAVLTTNLAFHSPFTLFFSSCLYLVVENLIVVPPLVCLVPEKVHLVELACLDVLQAVRFVPPVREDVERDLPADRKSQTEPLEDAEDGGKRNEKRKEERTNVRIHIYSSTCKCVYLNYNSAQLYSLKGA